MLMRPSGVGRKAEECPFENADPAVGARVQQIRCEQFVDLVARRRKSCLRDNVGYEVACASATGCEQQR